MRFSDITEDGTYTVNPDGSVERVNLTSGYTVAVEAISALLLTEESELPTYLPANLFFGKWTHPVSGVVYWDVVQVIESLLEAGNVARQRGELAIWDNLNNKEFFV